MLANSPVDWNAYHAASIDDEPITDVINMLESAAMMDASIITITARPEKWRKLTMGWMIKHQVPSDALLMRPDDVFRPSPEIKRELLLGHFGEGFREEIAFILEDRDDVVAMYREMGLTVFQVFARVK